MLIMPSLRVARWTNIVDEETWLKVYMIYQQYKTAIKAAYAGYPDVASEAKKAKAYRQWLQSLDISPDLRAPLVEQALALEEAFADLSQADS